MSEAMHSSSSIAAVPEDAHEKLLIDGSGVETKVGPVAKFHSDGQKHINDNELEQNIVINNLAGRKKANTEFIGLTKEELKAYINNPKWKRIRWIIAILYILILAALLVGSILLIIFSQRCPPKPKLDWYQKEIIYEIDVTTFRDANQDGIGDIKGVQEKLPYLEKNHIKSILLQSSIFNAAGGTSIVLDGQTPRGNIIDLLSIDQKVGSENDLEELSKVLNRKDMHLIIDLPLSSTFDPNGYSWYGSVTPLTTKINNPCNRDQSNLACRYLTSYGQLPLDFNDNQIADQADSRLRHWLLTKKLDGIRVNLPLDLDRSTGLYNISYKTINRWNELKKDIEKKTKPKLLLIDIPFGLQNIINNDNLHKQTAHSLLLLNNQQRSPIDAQQLDRRIESFELNHLSTPKFWQLGSKRRSDNVGLIDNNQLPREMVLTMAMLFGGTPIVLYGEELGVDQKSNPLMPWIPDGPYGGFSSCTSESCSRILSSYRLDLSKTSVKREEAVGGGSKDSLLTVFRRLSKLREADSFQFGLLETNFDSQTNIFWFIREAPGHRGYVIVLNLNKKEDKPSHISLYELTKHDVPQHIHYEYQWPQIHFSTSNKTLINSDNLLIHSQSINIFWWTPKLQKPNVLFKKAKEHSHTH